MTLLPNKAAIAQILTNQPSDAAPVYDNDAAIAAAVNGVIAALSGGTAGQALTAIDATSVQWANQ